MPDPVQREGIRSAAAEAASWGRSAPGTDDTCGATAAAACLPHGLHRSAAEQLERRRRPDRRRDLDLGVQRRSVDDLELLPEALEPPGRRLRQERRLGLGGSAVAL